MEDENTQSGTDPLLHIESYEAHVSSVITDEDRTIFAEKSDTEIAQILINLARFAPDPATFGNEAFTTIIAVDENGNSLPKNEAELLLEIAQRTGLVRRSDDGRLILSNEAKPKLRNILQQYDEKE